MAQFTRKGQELPPPLPAGVNKPDKGGCGCTEGSPSSSGNNQGGSCPSVTYASGGFDFVVRNQTTGECQKVSLDYIEDTQPIFTP